METIDELICAEFAKVAYSIIGEIAHIPIFSNEEKSDFWLVTDDYDIDVDCQKNLFDSYAKETNDYVAAPKNTSVLVLKKVEHIDESCKQWAVETENDKFYFKKYVLLYTDVAWSKLKNEILVNKNKGLSDYLGDRNVFEKLKEDSFDGAYTLLYGIAHKLPFLLVEMKKSELALAYPMSWSSLEVLNTNDWVNAIPNDDDDEMAEYLDNIIKSIANEQD